MTLTLTALQDAISDCSACPLHVERQGLPVQPDLTNIDVIGQDCVMIVFEQPTWVDEKSGQFGKAQYWGTFSSLVVNSGLSELPLVMTHRVKCRNPEGGVLIPSLYNCDTHLKSELELFNPSVVLLLGTLVGQEVYGKDYRVSRDHGQPRSLAPTHSKGGRVYIGTYHPGAVAQSYSELYGPVLEDYKLAKDIFTSGNRTPKDNAQA